MDTSSNTLAQVVDTITELVKNHKHNCVIIQGEIGAGKTRFAERLVIALRQRKFTVGGIISPRILDSDETIGYRVRDITTGEEQLLATVAPPGIRVGKFYLLQDALTFARTAIEQALSTANIGFIDEVGRLELAEKGHAPALRVLLQSDAIPVLFIRTKFIGGIVDKFNIADYAAFPVG